MTLHPASPSPTILINILFAIDLRHEENVR